MWASYRTGAERPFRFLATKHTGKTPEESKISPLHKAVEFGTENDVLSLILDGADINAKDIGGCTPLWYSLYHEKEKMAKTLLKSGASPSSATTAGAFPLHLAAWKNMPGAARALIEAGADPNIRHRSDGATPLFCTLRSAAPNPEMIRLLLQAGANPFTTIKIPGKLRTAWFDASQKPEAVKVVLGLERHPAFAAAKDLHDICETLWPASREHLSNETIAWAIKTLGFQTNRLPASMKEVERVLAKTDLFNCAKDWQKILDRIPASASLEMIRLRLIECNPAYAKAWEIANREEPLKVREMEANIGIGGDAAPAFYNGELHSMWINGGLPVWLKAYFLVFELFNALQKDAFLKVGNLALSGLLDREEYATLMEGIEFVTLQMTHRTLGLPNPFSTPLKYWKVNNRSIPPCEEFPKGLSSHTDFYRKKWDLVFSAVYLAKHPFWFAQRKKELFPPVQTALAKPRQPG